MTEDEISEMYEDLADEAFGKWLKSFDGIRTQAMREAGADPVSLLRLAFTAGYLASKREG